jgi:DNA topoisomerase IA
VEFPSAAGHPGSFDLDPIPDSEARLKQVLKLAKRKDIDRIVNACDAGREGELIFRYIMDIGKNPEARAAALDAVDDQQRHPRSLGTSAAMSRCARSPMPPSAARSRTGWSASTPPAR